MATHYKLESNFLDLHQINESLNFLKDEYCITDCFIGGILFPFNKHEIRNVKRQLSLYCNTEIGIRLPINMNNKIHKVFVTNPRYEICELIYNEILSNILTKLKICKDKFNIFNMHILIKEINYCVNKNLSEQYYYAGICTANKDDIKTACCRCSLRVPREYISNQIDILFNNCLSFDPKIIYDLMTASSEAYIEYKGGCQYIANIFDASVNNYIVSTFNELSEINQLFPDKVLLNDSEPTHLDFNN